MVGSSYSFVAEQSDWLTAPFDQVRICWAGRRQKYGPGGEMAGSIPFERSLPSSSIVDDN